MDIRKGFLQRNHNFIDVLILRDNKYDGLDEIQVDAWSFTTQINNLTRAYMGQSTMLGSFGEDLRNVIDRQNRIEKKMDTIIKLLKAGKQEQPASDRLVYSERVGSYKPTTPAKLFVQFFAESLHRLYYTRLKTNSWKCLEKKDRERISTSFRRQKRCIRYMLCFCDNISSRPHPTSPEYTHWMADLDRISRLAEKRMLDYLNRKSEKAYNTLKFTMIQDAAFEDLDKKFSNLNGLKGMTMEDFDMLKVQDEGRH